jgi:hypothetical protein
MTVLLLGADQFRETEIPPAFEISDGCREVHSISTGYPIESKLRAVTLRPRGEESQGGADMNWPTA